jgi:hypothetical protein
VDETVSQRRITMPFTDPLAVERVVYNVIVNWLADWQKKDPKVIQQRLNWTLTGKPPNGFDMQPQTYTTMCSQVSAQIQTSLGRAVTLPQSWRQTHKDDSVATFIGALTVEILSAKLTSTGKGALTWSLTK